MRSQIEAQAPARMISETAELCQNIRQRKPSIIYSELLRENILEVLKCSFPRLSAALPPGTLEDIATRFLARHGASRPQFHHIATEMVEFAQSDMTLSKPLVCLLEYEWVLLSTEIDPAHVPAPRAVEDLALPASKIALNPTAEMLAAPFDLTQSIVPAELDGSEKTYVYAVYRTANHAVVTRSLSYSDYCLIDLLRREGSLALSDLQTASPVELSADAIRQWVTEQSQNGLVVCLTES